MKGVTVFRGGFSMLSNEHQASITVEGKEWRKLQQYISYQKARMADRADIAAEVRSTDDPREATNLTRELCRDDPKWKVGMETAMERAMGEKFKGDRYRQALIDAGENIGELTHDKIMGIGMVAEAKWFNQREWVGENVPCRKGDNIKQLQTIHTTARYV